MTQVSFDVLAFKFKKLLFRRKLFRLLYAKKFIVLFSSQTMRFIIILALIIEGCVCAVENGTHSLGSGLHAGKILNLKFKCGKIKQYFILAKKNFTQFL